MWCRAPVPTVAEASARRLGALRGRGDSREPPGPWELREPVSRAPNGTDGSNDSDGSSEAALKTQVASLNLKLDALEETLGGLDNADLLGAVDATEGLTNGELTEAVQSLPVVDALCEQNEELTKQINTIAGVVGGLGLSPALEVIGLLKIPTLPAALDPFTCGTP